MENGLVVDDDGKAAAASGGRKVFSLLLSDLLHHGRDALQHIG